MKNLLHSLLIGLSLLLQKLKGMCRLNEGADIRSKRDSKRQVLGTGEHPENCGFMGEHQENSVVLRESSQRTLWFYGRAPRELSASDYCMLQVWENGTSFSSFGECGLL